MKLGLGLLSHQALQLSTAKLHYASFHARFVPHLVLDDEFEVAERLVEERKERERKKKKKKGGFKLRIKIENELLRRLLSGAVAGAVSRTAVAPLETIKTHLMVGNSANSMAQVFDKITMAEGWKGQFRGNFVNVIRVAPSKAIEVFGLATFISYA
ncbi:adenine nucleotide transporter BT1, chloroplastic/mitochondrial-like [Hibiscus syriacus]|uniref:adenine nucleotide transporter BT1, chloroplastic/mitochondrial-like n=1 Tax=Hibiscus syriacus TaxID=106335 RepID=UPI0019205387|nr:adenine nucleotide transporter BT1, chloroplastic/mitochondrial-like [Hibiscus syriacus]